MTSRGFLPPGVAQLDNQGNPRKRREWHQRRLVQESKLVADYLGQEFG